MDKVWSISSRYNFTTIFICVTFLNLLTSGFLSFCSIPPQNVLLILTNCRPSSLMQDSVTVSPPSASLLLSSGITSLTFFSCAFIRLPFHCTFLPLNTLSRGVSGCLGSLKLIISFWVSPRSYTSLCFYTLTGLLLLSKIITNVMINKNKITLARLGRKYCPWKEVQLVTQCIYLPTILIYIFHFRIYKICRR